MTCIVGIVNDGKVYIGGDSLGSDSSNFSGTVRKDIKVFRNGNFIMGFTTSYRMGQLLRYKFSASRDIGNDEDVMSYMINVFVEDVRKCLKDGGFAEVEKGRESAGVFLIGFKGRLFTLYSDYQIAESMDNYAACGCGGNYALGSLYSTKSLLPKKRITEALKAAEHYSIGVKAPFTTIIL